MACSFAKQPLDGEVNYISGIEPSGIKRERPFQTQLRSTRLSLSAGSPWICRANRGRYEPGNVGRTGKREATNVGRPCGDYEQQSWLRGRIVVETGEVERPGPTGLCSSVIEVAKGSIPRLSASAGESC